MNRTPAACATRRSSLPVFGQIRELAWRAEHWTDADDRARSVHELRRCCRRLEEALGFLQDPSRPQLLRRVGRRSRRIRRAAGGVRDADVALWYLRRLGRRLRGRWEGDIEIAMDFVRRARGRARRRLASRTGRGVGRALAAMGEQLQAEQQEVGVTLEEVRDRLVVRREAVEGLDSRIALGPVAAHRVRRSLRRWRDALRVAHGAFPGRGFGTLADAATPAVEALGVAHDLHVVEQVLNAALADSSVRRGLVPLVRRPAGMWREWGLRLGRGVLPAGAATPTARA